MKRIRIGQAERDLEGANPNWIREHVDDLRARGQSVCVEVTLHFGPVDMILATPACSGGGGSREADRQEMKILELWRKKGLNNDDFNVRDLIDFVERLDIL